MLVEPPISFFRVNVHNVSGTERFQPPTAGSGQPQDQAGNRVTEPRYAVAVAHSSLYSSPMAAQDSSMTALPTAAAGAGSRQWALLPPAQPANQTSVASSNDGRRESLLSSTFATPSPVPVNNGGTANQQQNVVNSGLYDKCGRVHIEVWELPSLTQLLERVQTVTGSNNSPHDTMIQQRLNAAKAMSSAANNANNSEEAQDAEYLANLLLLGSISNQQRRSGTASPASTGTAAAGGGASASASLRSVLDTMVDMQSIVLVADNQFSLLDVATRTHQPAALAAGGMATASLPLQNLPLNTRMVTMSSSLDGTPSHGEQRCVASASIEHIESTLNPDVSCRLPTSTLRTQAQLAHQAAGAALNQQYGAAATMGAATVQQQQQQQVPILSMGLIHFVSDETLNQWHELRRVAAGNNADAMLGTTTGSMLHPFFDGGALMGNYWATLPVHAHTESTFLNGGGMMAYENNTNVATTTMAASQFGGGAAVTCSPSKEERTMAPIFCQPATGGGAAGGNFNAAATAGQPQSLPPLLAMDTAFNFAMVRNDRAARAEHEAALASYERRRQQLAQQFAEQYHQQQRQQQSAQRMMRVINANGEETLVPAEDDPTMLDAVDPHRMLEEQKRHVASVIGPAPTVKPSETVGATSFTVYDLCKWLVRFDMLQSTAKATVGASRHIGGSTSFTSSFRIQHNANDGSVTLYLPLVPSSRAMQQHQLGTSSPFVLVVKVHSLPWFLNLIQGGPCPYYFNRVTNPTHHAAMQYQNLQQQQMVSGGGVYQQGTAANTATMVPATNTDTWSQKLGYRFLSASMVASIFRLKIRACMARYALGHAVIDAQYKHLYPIMKPTAAASGKSAQQTLDGGRTQHLLPLSNATAFAHYGTQELFAARRNFLGTVLHRYQDAANSVNLGHRHPANDANSLPLSPGGGNNTSSGTFLSPSSPGSIGGMSPVINSSGLNLSGAGGNNNTMTNESELIATEFTCTMKASLDLMAALLKVQYFQLIATDNANSAMDRVANTVQNGEDDMTMAAGSTAKQQQQHGAKYVLWSHRRCSRVLTLLFNACIQAPRSLLSWQDPLASGIVTGLYVAVCLIPTLAIPCLVIVALYFMLAPSIEFGQPLFLQHALGSAKQREDEAVATDGDDASTVEGESAGAKKTGAARIAMAVRHFLSVPDVTDEEPPTAVDETRVVPRSRAPAGGGFYGAQAGVDAYGNPLSPRSRINAGYRSFHSGGGGSGAVGTMFDDSMQLYGSFTQGGGYNSGFESMLGHGSGSFLSRDRGSQPTGNNKVNAIGERASIAVAQQTELQRLTEQLLQTTNAIAEIVDRLHGVLLWRSPIISLLIVLELVACLLFVLFSPATWITALVFGLAILLPMSPVRYVALYTANLIMNSPALSNCKFIAMN